MLIGISVGNLFQFTLFTIQKIIDFIAIGLFTISDFMKEKLCCCFFNNCCSNMFSAVWTFIKEKLCRCCCCSCCSSSSTEEEENTEIVNSYTVQTLNQLKMFGFILSMLIPLLMAGLFAAQNILFVLLGYNVGSIYAINVGPAYFSLSYYSPKIMKLIQFLRAWL